MNLANHIAAAIPAALNMRVCSRNDCEHHGEPQPVTSFYRNRHECKTCSRRLNNRSHRVRQKTKAASPFVVDRERRTQLPIDPWRTWLGQRAAQEGMETLCASLGITERAVWRWLHESARADLDAVDRALCHRGTPWVLREIYPHIYQFEDAA